MSRHDDLERKRDAVLKARARATRKINAMAKGTYTTGKKDPLKHLMGAKYAVNITGTKYDPRSPIQGIRRMTMRQLDAAMDRLNEFNNSRNVGYYAGHDGAIISRRTMLEATYQTKRYNKMIRDYRESVKDIEIPWIGENLTAEDYDRDWRVKGAYLEGQAFYDMQERRLPTPRRFLSEKGAKVWSENLKDEMLPSAQKKRVRAAREQIKQMVDVIGEPALVHKVHKLNDAQLWFMWTNDPSLANAFSLMYEHSKNEDNPDKSDNYKQVMAQVAEDSREEIGELLDYGKEIPLK